MFELTKFIANPTQAELFQVNRVDLMKIAAHHKVSFHNTLSKRELQVLLVESLHKQGVFGDEEKLVDYPEADEGSSGDLALQIKKLELQAKEHDRVLLKDREEWEREKERRREREKHELELKKLEMEQACRLKEIELRARERGVTDVSDFDVSRNIRMVPPFREQEADKFFALFERVAINLKWPISLVQKYHLNGRNHVKWVLNRSKRFWLILLFSLLLIFHLRFCLLLMQVTQVRELYFSNEIKLVLNIPFAIFHENVININDVTPPLRRRDSLLSLLSNISMSMWVPFRIHWLFIQIITL